VSVGVHCVSQVHLAQWRVGSQPEPVVVKRIRGRENMTQAQRLVGPRPPQHGT
jgi:hypothetical protein